MNSQDSLFGPEASAAPVAHAAPGVPLAERLRPHSLDEVIGQQHLLGPGKPLRRAFETQPPLVRSTYHPAERGHWLCAAGAQCTR